MARRFRKKPPLAVWMTAVVVLLLSFRGFQTWQQESAKPPALDDFREGAYDVVRIVDGDTIIIAPAGSYPRDELPLDRRPRQPLDADQPFPTGRLRLLGIDCPESVKPNHPVEPFGPEASQFTREFLSGGQAELRLDRRRVDQYERFLAYVFVAGECLNIELVRNGLAEAKPYRGDSASMTRKLYKAQDEAKEEGRGIWSQ